MGKSKNWTAIPVARHDTQEVPKGTLGSIKKAAGLK